MKGVVNRLEYLCSAYLMLETFPCALVHGLTHSFVSPGLSENPALVTLTSKCYVRTITLWSKVLTTFFLIDVLGRGLNSTGRVRS
jgi:hypothetical protein